MIIKGNNVGYPLPDPRKGLEMQGGVNMNGQKLNGIAAPEADDDAVNKKYAEDYTNNKTIARAKLEADALYSPYRRITELAYSVSMDDLGVTLGNNNSSNGFVFTFDYSVSKQLPVGAEIAILRNESAPLKVSFTGGMSIGISGNSGWSDNITVELPNRFDMIALKKIGASSKDYWVLTGNVEVV